MRKRPWLAALLAFVHPGLGHVYLREWLRALLWFGLVLTTASFLVPEGIVPETISVESIRQMSEALPLEAVLGLATITIMSMVDAYWIANRRNEQRQETVEGVRCPNCGRDVDEDLDFCHWCTTQLDADETDGADEPSRA
ncbi:zinc ribbon domain-containing protein [Halorientalis salina]|uniref:zinc ribbon domain-containing protein n=1 Tax=Halorientalis salina TaxID=2932266 RepID=UPI002022AE21|nr:zinc ribbon domain-containing protein [Halorientalis salina]